MPVPGRGGLRPFLLIHYFYSIGLGITHLYFCLSAEETWFVVDGLVLNRWRGLTTFLGLPGIGQRARNAGKPGAKAL